VGNAARLPIEFGPEKNVVWKTPSPFGHSSPVIASHLIFLTGVEDGVRAGVGNEKDKFVDRGKLYTFAVNRRSGKIAWRREVPRERQAQYQTNNSPATPSAVTDGANVYVFFQDFGFLVYTIGGVERWRLPVGPFNNMNGAGSSPILFHELLILECDQDSGSYMPAVDTNTGRVRWKIQRPEATRSYITTPVFQPEHGPA
jgi:outer membrane protein assembly factor BamB